MYASDRIDPSQWRNLCHITIACEHRGIEAMEDLSNVDTEVKMSVRWEALFSWSLIISLSFSTLS